MTVLIIQNTGAIVLFSGRGKRGSEQRSDLSRLRVARPRGQLRRSLAMALTCCLCPWSGPHPFLLQKSLPKAHLHTFWAGRLWEVSQPFSRTQLLGRCAHSCRQTSSRSGWGEDGRGDPPSTPSPSSLCWLPTPTSAWWRNGWGPKSRFTASPAPWAPSQPHGIGARTRMNVFGSRLSP